MKKVVNIISISIIILILMTSCVESCKRMIAREQFFHKNWALGNGNVITRNISVSEFTEIRMTGFVNVQYMQSDDSNSIAQLMIDENLFNYVNIYVKDQILYVGLSSDSSNISVQNMTTCLLVCSSKKLEKVENIGTGDLYFETPFVGNVLDIRYFGQGDWICKNSIQVAKLDVLFQGTGDFICQDPLQVIDFDLIMEGVGNAKLNGNIQKATIKISGTGDIEAGNLIVDELKLSQRGMGNVVMGNIQNTLSMQIIGTGDFTYSGNPKIIEQQVSGLGTIRKK